MSLVLLRVGGGRKGPSREGQPSHLYLSRGSSPREQAGCLHFLLMLLPASQPAPQPLPPWPMPPKGKTTMLDGLARCRVPLLYFSPHTAQKGAAGAPSDIPAAGMVKPISRYCVQPPQTPMLRPGQAAGMQAGTPICAKAAPSSDSPSLWQQSAGSKEAPLCRAVLHTSAASNRSPARLESLTASRAAHAQICAEHICTCSGSSKTPLRASQAPSETQSPGRS